MANSKAKEPDKWRRFEEQINSPRYAEAQRRRAARDQQQGGRK